jgi:hypothetical protein
MNAHKNVRLTPYGRELMIERIRKQGWTAATAAGAAGVSERIAYKWLARYRGGGTAALHNARPVHRCAGLLVDEADLVVFFAAPTQIGTVAVVHQR